MSNHLPGPRSGVRLPSGATCPVPLFAIVLGGGFTSISWGFFGLFAIYPWWVWPAVFVATSVASIFALARAGASISPGLWALENRSAFLQYLVVYLLAGIIIVTVIGVAFGALYSQLRAAF